MTNTDLNKRLDDLLDEHTVALTGYTTENTTNPDLPSLLEITDYDTRVINTLKLKQALNQLIAEQVEQGCLQHQSTPTAQGHEAANLSPELRDALVALGEMYNQYCGDNYGHDFMGAGEHAIEILENYGLGNEKDGVDEIALDNLERGIDLAATDHKPSTNTANPPTPSQGDKK